MASFSGEQLMYLKLVHISLLGSMLVVDYRLFTFMCAQGGFMITEMKVLS